MNQGTWMKRGVVAAALIAVASATLTACGGDESADGLTTIKVSYSEKVADNLPLWAAKEQGLFEAHGLEVELVNLDSEKGFPALLSGQVDMAAIGGTQVVSAAAAGNDVKILGAATPVLPFELYADVATGVELKGKKVGYTSKSGSQYVGTVEAIKAAGLEPSDVDLVPLGNVSNVNNALLSGAIDAAATHPPASLQFKNAGLHRLVDLAKEDIPYMNVSYVALTSYNEEHSEVLDQFFAALKQGTDFVRGNQKGATRILGDYLGEDDQAALDDAWNYYTSEVIQEAPLASPEQLELSVEFLDGSVEGVEDVDLDDLIDPSHVEKAFGTS